MRKSNSHVTNIAAHSIAPKLNSTKKDETGAGELELNGQPGADWASSKDSESKTYQSKAIQKPIYLGYTKARLGKSQCLRDLSSLMHAGGRPDAWWTNK
jgi:hypothetical protein